MKTVFINGSLRESVGKKDAKKLRKNGLVPCVIYGGKTQKHFSVPEISFKNIVFTPEIAFIDIDLNGEKHHTILQDIQYHPVTDKILHADFLEIFDKPITMKVPIKLTGSSAGVLKGGRLSLIFRKLSIKAIPDNIPENITIDITNFDIGHSVKVSSFKDEKFEILHPENTVVVGILKARKVEELVKVEEEGEETIPTSRDETEGATKTKEDKTKEKSKE